MMENVLFTLMGNLSILHPNYKMKISREVAKNATVESAFNSPVSKMFLICREMVDLLR